MFNDETVFILGAGASWHYNCPTGEELIRQVQEHAKTWEEHARSRGFKESLLSPETSPPRYFNHLNANCEQALTEFQKQCAALSNKISQVNPLVIDYFLAQNQDLQDIGKLFISYELLIREQEYKHTCKHANRNRKRCLENSPYLNEKRHADGFDIQGCKDDWYRFLIDAIASNCTTSSDILRNKVCLVTFNYDVTLEYRLARAINQIQLFTEEDKKTFFTNPDLVLHVYGQVRNNAFDEAVFGSFPQNLENREYQSMLTALDQAWTSAQTIYTIPEKKKESEHAERAINKIKSAKNIFIFGYGFDTQNNQILKLKESLLHIEQYSTKKIYFTNFGNSNRINKRAGMLFLSRENAFLSDFIAKSDYEQNVSIRHCEKSIRDVYGALEYDFDLF